MSWLNMDLSLALCFECTSHCMLYKTIFSYELLQIKAYLIERGVDHCWFLHIYYSI